MQKTRAYRIIVCIIGAALLSLLNTIGLITEKALWTDHSRYRVGLVSFICGGILIFAVIIVLFRTLDWVNRQPRMCNRFERFITSLDLKWIWLILVAAWLPYAIMHYPTRLGGGAMNQIAMFFGEETRARNMSSIIYEGHYYSNHHPVLLTLYYGLFWKIGEIVGNVNMAVFALSCLNIMICALCLSFMINRIKSHLSERITTILIIYMSAWPYFGAYAYTCCKDNIYAAVLVVFYTLIAEMAIFGEMTGLKDSVLLLLVSVLIPFLKSQGVIIVVISLVLAAVANKGIRKKTIGVALISAFLFIVLFSRILMPMLKISPAGRQEALSVPFQQTALLLKQHPESVTDEDYRTIDAVLPADELPELYEKGIADGVKFEFDQSSTSEEVREYLKTWAAGFLKHPLVYVRAWSELTDAYYYMGYDETNIDIYHKLDVYGAFWPDWVVSFEEAEYEFFEEMVDFPVLGQLLKCSIICWISLLCLLYLLYLRQFRRALIMMSICLNFFVLLLCPANGYLRYTLPLIWLLPVGVLLICGKISTMNNAGEKTADQ